MTLQVGPLHFKDSFRFLNASLETLVENLKSQGEDKFNLLKDEYPNHFKFLLRKGVFPYEFLNSPDKLNYIGLPPKEAFYNKLTDTCE